MRHRLSTNPNKPLRTPFKSSMMVPIFKPAVEKNPGLPYDHLRSLLKPYAKDYAITVALLQGGRSATKKELFGTPEDNVSYAGSIAREMRRLGHEVKLIFLSRKETDLAEQQAALTLSRRIGRNQYEMVEQPE